MCIAVQLQTVHKQPDGDIERVFRIESRCESLRAIVFNEGRSIRCVFRGDHLLPEWAAILVRRAVRGDPLAPADEALIREGHFTAWDGW
jgi:hypothetical protein